MMNLSSGIHPGVIFGATMKERDHQALIPSNKSKYILSPASWTRRLDDISAGGGTLLSALHK